MPLIALAVLAGISVLATRLLLQPLVWLGSISLPNWLWLAVLLVMVSWFMGE